MKEGEGGRETVKVMETEAGEERRRDRVWAVLVSRGIWEKQSAVYLEEAPLGTP